MKKLKYFIFDKAISNDIYVEVILKELWLNFIKEKCRCYYIGHNIKIATQVFLYKKNEKTFTVKVIGTQSITNIKK